jgi:hypothetical protein
MQLHNRVWYLADCSYEGGGLSECDEVAVQEHAIINEFIAAPDAVSVLGDVLRELAEASDYVASEEHDQP